MIPQLTLIAISIILLCLNIPKHGKMVHYKYNIYLTIVTIVICYTILYFGGFWDCMIESNL